MSKIILIASILLALTFTVGSGVYFPAHAWLRDANISDSKDSLGVGWLFGPYLTGEKLIDEKSSVGLYYLPTVYLKGTSSFGAFQAGYNNQFLGEKGGNFALSYCIAAICLPFPDAKWAIFPDSWSALNGKVSGWTILPDLGLGLSWRIFDPLTFKLQTTLYFPTFFEFAYKYDKSVEFGIGLGMPAQFIGIRYLL